MDNVVHANLLALSCGPDGVGKVYNVACGASTSVLDLFRLLGEQAGPRAVGVKPRFEEPRPGDVRHSLASIEAARSDLGYAPLVGVEEGIRRMFDWYREELRLQAPLEEVGYLTRSPSRPSRARRRPS